MRCTENQTKKKRKQTKKAQNWKTKKSAKLRRTFLLCKNTFPRCWNTDQKTGPKTAALRCRANQTERKRQLAKLASKEAGRTHLAAETTAERREDKTRKQTLKKYFVNIHKRTSKTTHETHGYPTHRPPPPAPNRHPPPKGPPKTQTDQILAWVLDQCHGTRTTLKVRSTCQ